MLAAPVQYVGRTDTKAWPSEWKENAPEMSSCGGTSPSGGAIEELENVFTAGESGALRKKLASEGLPRVQICFSSLDFILPQS
jgi:hypothetical protein